MLECAPVSARGWLETYRGTVYRWEVDNNDHLTVAYYLSRFGDAAQALLDDLGLGAGYAGRSQKGCVTGDCYIRYIRELRVGDLMHIESGVIDVEPNALLFGHHLFDSADGALCTTVEHRVRHVDFDAGTVAALSPAQRQAALVRRIEWAAPPREKRPRPATLEGFRQTAREEFRASEWDALGQVPLSAYIHVFSAANGHALAGFGMTPDYMRRTHHGFSTFEFQLALEHKIGPGDHVAVRSALLHLGNSSMRILHVMSEARSGRTVATLEQLGVHFDQTARRPAPLPGELRKAAEAVLVRG